MLRGISLLLLFSHFTAQAQNSYHYFQDDTVFGHVKKPKVEDSMVLLGTHKIPLDSIDGVFVYGQRFVVRRMDDKKQVMQLLCGDNLRLFQSMGNDEHYFIVDEHNDLFAITKERANVTLARAFQSCESYANAMAYKKVRYRKQSMVDLVNGYYQCKGLEMPVWTRPDSLAFDLSAYYYTANASVMDQDGKDHSGNFSDINYNGIGFKLSAFENRPVSISAGLQIYDMSTQNAYANVSPFINPDIYASVTYEWSNYEIPIEVRYSHTFKGWKPYAGIRSSFIITKSMSVTEEFFAPFAPDGITVSSNLETNEHLALGGTFGIEKSFGPNWLVDFNYTIQRRELNFNMVRSDQTLQQRAPDIRTFRISTLDLFPSATDLTKFRFTTQQFSIGIKYRLFTKYHTLN